MGSKTSVSKRYKCKQKSLTNRCKTCKEQSCPQYWEARLKRMHLTMDRASHIGTETITYGHMIEHFGDWEGKIVYSPPTGERLEDDGWVTVE
jgi:hypothetical protein